MESVMYGVPVITNPDSCGTIEFIENNVNGLVGENILSLINKYHSDSGLIIRNAPQGKEIVYTKFSVHVQRSEMIKALSL